MKAIDLMTIGRVVGGRRSRTPGTEGAFLACSFWLRDAYTLSGRLDEARAMFERLLSYANDLGLFAEEYDPVVRRQLGNFPQAFNHFALVNSAHTLFGTSNSAAANLGAPA